MYQSKHRNKQDMNMFNLIDLIYRVQSNPQYRAYPGKAKWHCIEGGGGGGGG